MYDIEYNKMTPTDAEIEEFSNSLEEHIGTSSNVMLKYVEKGEFLMKRKKFSYWLK